MLVLGQSAINNNFRAPETKPIKIKTIIAELSYKPILKSRASISKHAVSLKANNPKRIKPVNTQTTKPAFFQKGMFVETIRQPIKSVQPIKVVSSGEPLQTTMTTKVARRSFKTPAPEPSIRMRNTSNESNFLAVSGPPNQEENRGIRTPLNNQIQPVQLASIPAEIAGDTKEGELEAGRENSTRSSPPKIRSDSSDIDLDALKKSFASSVSKKIDEAKYYPRIAQNRGWEGKPVVEFQLGKNGKLLSYSITVASPYEILNQAAIDAVKNASPYPEIPESLKSNFIRLKVPISFELD